MNTVEIFKYVKENRGIKMFIELLNMGSLSDYLNRRHLLGQTLTEKEAQPMLENFVKSMQELSGVENIRAHGALHSRILYVHNHRIVVG